jgi:hypothetical protein
MMANNNGLSGAHMLTAAVASISATDSRNQFPHQKRRWRGWWTRFWCFGSKQQVKRIVPASHIPEGTVSGNEAQLVDGAHPPVTLSLTLVAPPSSPASFLNSTNSSAVQSPAGIFSLSAMSASIYSPGGPTSNIFTTGPYAHETQLVSPPFFSTANTEPSTAPFTPPESVHLTTPSSPEVPFAQLFASSLDAKIASRKRGLTLYSPLTSPRYVATKDIQAAYQLYPGSPASHLISPKSGVSGSGASSPFTDLEFPARLSVSHSAQDALFPTYDPSRLFNLDKILPKTFIFSQDSEVSCSGSSEGFCLDKVKFQYRSDVQYGGEQYNYIPKPNVCCSSGEDKEQKRQMETDKCCASMFNQASKESLNKSETKQLQANRASFGLSAGGVFSEVSGDKFAGSQLGTWKSYKDQSPKIGNFSGNPKMQMAQLALSDSGTDSSSIDCFLQGVEAPVRKETVDGLIGSAGLNSALRLTEADRSVDISRVGSQVAGQGISGSSEHSEDHNSSVEVNNLQFLFKANRKYSWDSSIKEKLCSYDSKCSAHSDEEVHETFGDFKFDKVEKTDNLSMKKEFWSKHNEKRTAESGIPNWGFFHMMPEGVS